MKMSSKVPRGLVSDEYKKQTGFKGGKKKVKSSEKHGGCSKNENNTSLVNENVGETKEKQRKSSFKLKLHKMCSFDL